MRLLRPLGSLAMTPVVAILVFLVALNLAARIVYLRLDFSEGRVYSISPATKKILRGLEDPVIVKVYFSRDLPQPYATHGDYLKDLLGAYRTYGGRNFEFKFVSYPNEENFRREALTMGIAPVQMTYIAKDKYEVKDGFMGAVLLHGDKREVIPVIRDLAGLEYDLTTRVKKLVSKKPRVLAVLKGKETQPLPNQMEKELGEYYELKDLRLDDPADPVNLPSALLVLGPKESFNDADLARLEQMILRGVSAGFFLDTKNVDLMGGSFFARPLDTGLDKLLSRWGLALEKRHVLDIQNQNISIQQQAGPYTIQNIVGYPLMPIVTNLNEASPITKGLDQLVLPFASPISTASVKVGELTVLARSTRLSWSKEYISNLSPLANFNPEESDPKGPFVLAVSLTGKLDALYKTPPESLAKSSDTLVSGWLASSSGQSRMVVCGTSRMIDPQLSSNVANQIFVLNTADWLSEDPDLIAIRSKAVRIRPFTVNPGYWVRQAIKAASLFLAPLLILLLGLIRWRLRRRWKLTLRQEYAT